MKPRSVPPISNLVVLSLTKGTSPSIARRLTRDFSIEDDELLTVGRHVIMRFGCVLLVRSHGQECVDRPELLPDHGRQRRESLIMRAAVDLVIDAPPAQHRRKDVLARICASAANNARLRQFGHPSLFSCSNADRPGAPNCKKLMQPLVSPPGVLVRYDACDAGSC